MAQKAILSKSSYLRGVQCLKSLYFYKNHYNLREATSPVQQALFDRGHQVGKLARDLFPGGADCSVQEAWRSAEAVKKTQEAIAGGYHVLYEAAFIYQGVLAIADILVRKQDGWHVFEVKSSVHLSGVYFQDAALQYYVIQNALGLRSFNLVTVDKAYVRKGWLSVEKLFKLHPITGDVKRRQAEVKRRLQQQMEMLQIGVLPNIPIGKHCYAPYPCDFMQQCWANLGADEIVKMSGLGIEAKLALIEKGYRKPDEIPPALLPVSVTGHAQGQATAEPEKLRRWLNGLRFPLVFFDIEFLQLAIPEYEGTHPYESLPFILSAHRLEHPDAAPTHFLFMLDADQHPYHEIAIAFTHFCADARTIVAYDTGAETRALAAMVQHNAHSETEHALKHLMGKLKDLRYPFVHQLLYLPEVGASTSLKKVLPALVPGQSFQDLAVVDGFAAARHCEQVYYMPPGPARDVAVADLQAYATRDTWGMYLVWKALYDRYFRKEEADLAE